MGPLHVPFSKVPFPVGESRAHLMLGSLGPHESPKGISVCSTSFAQITLVPNTQNHRHV